MLNPSRSRADVTLPVLVSPTSFTFYTDDQSSHKQVLTIFNPYDVPLEFSVWCTAPKKYLVVNPVGTIRAKCGVDIVVRHTDICINNERDRDKFRIRIHEHGNRKKCGKMDIFSVLLPTKSVNLTTGLEDKFFSLSQTSQNTDTQGRNKLVQSNVRTPESGPSLIVILAGLICIAALMLPIHGENASQLPDYLHLSVNQKLIAAYVLGLVTLLILHT